MEVESDTATLETNLIKLLKMRHLFTVSHEQEATFTLDVSASPVQSLDSFYQHILKLDIRPTERPDEGISIEVKVNLAAAQYSDPENRQAMMQHLLQKKLYKTVENRVFTFFAVH